MSKVLMFYIDGCPYCANAKAAIAELKEQNPEYAKVQIEMVNERKNPEISEKYDYYYVPAMFVNEEKVYEAQPGESYEECLENVRAVFKKCIG